MTRRGVKLLASLKAIVYFVVMTAYGTKQTY